jgi:hypothetical protein
MLTDLEARAAAYAVLNHAYHLLNDVGLDTLADRADILQRDIGASLPDGMADRILAYTTVSIHVGVI